MPIIACIQGKRDLEAGMKYCIENKPELEASAFVFLWISQILVASVLTELVETLWS